jgi:hypothetical protein
VYSGFVSFFFVCVQVCCSVICILVFLGFLVLCLYLFLVLGHQTMDKVQKYTSINDNFVAIVTKYAGCNSTMQQFQFRLLYRVFLNRISCQ